MSIAGNNVTPPRSLGASIRLLSSKWGWFVALGALFVITGALALVTVLPATLVSTVWIGAMLFVFGIGETIAAFQFKEWGRFFLWLVMGLVYIAAGVMTFINPVLAAISFTLIIAVALIVGGLIRIWLAFQMKEQRFWGFVAFSGAISLILGFMIIAQWPASGLYVLGIFLGVDLMFSGFGWISTGLAIRRLTDGK